MQKILIALACLAVSGLVRAESAALMVYKVWEQGGEPYFSRILVTDTHVRFDEGQDTGGYTLFDRLKQTVFNVSVEDRSVLLIAPQLEAVPETNTLILDEKKSVDEKAPMIAGKRPVSVELLANGEVCGTVVAVAGLMDDALAGLRELRQVLARVHAGTQAAQPEELQTACDLATNIHAPTRMLDHGLPVEQRSEGSVQLLVDFSEQVDVQASLFEVPENFHTLSMPTLPAI
jgi:hypothetical protein